MKSADTVRLIDTHAHLTDPSLAEQLNAVLSRAEGAGVERIVVVGIDATTSRMAVELARLHPQLVAAVGIQPNHVHEAQPGDWETIVELARDPVVHALGETGLDGYWKDAPMDIQRDYFDRHLRMSRETGLPFIVHLRDSGAEVLEMLEAAYREGSLRGVMHSYTGDDGLARRCVEMGLHISFAGMVTFKQSDALREVAKSVPADRLLIETDCPYLSPEPLRGKRPNEPARVRHTAECLAKTRGVSLSQLATETTENAKRLFRMD